MQHQDSEHWIGLESLSKWIAAHANEAEVRGNGLVQEMAKLHGCGLLFACVPTRFGGSGLGQEAESTRRTFEILRQIGRASLPVARLFEGHINAIKLISLYGSEEIKADLFLEISGGMVLGVWAADGSSPLIFDEGSNGVIVLHGKKIFASGLGCVSKAVVAAKPRGGSRQSSLFIVSVSDVTRQDITAWGAAGMKATLSGDFNFDGLTVPTEMLLGKPGDYEKEPFFDGGVWRYCAAHIGGAEALIDHCLDALVERKHLDAPLQLARMARSISHCRAAASMIREWALRVENAGLDRRDSPDDAAAGALLARAFVADMAIDVLQQCERCLGTSAHMSDNAIERLRRDLSLYIRQAAPDSKLLKAALLLASPSSENRRLW